MRIESKHLFTRAIIVLSCIAGLGSSSALADEHVLILMDRTGSMAAQSVPGLTRFAVAKARIQGYLQVVPATTTKYAFWTFEGTSATPVFPFSANATRGQISASVDSVTLGGMTPLAGSICSAIQALIDYLPTQLHTKRIYVVTDGLENSTPNTNECYGPSSALPFPNLVSGSWQWKVRNKACTGVATSPGPCVLPPPYPPITLITDIDYIFTENIPLTGVSYEESEDMDRTGGSMTASQAIAALSADADLFKGLVGSSGRYAGISEKTPLPVATLRAGDANMDGCVNIVDRSAVLSKYGQAVLVDDPVDFNRNRIIDGGDYQTVLDNYGQGCQ